VDLIGYDRNIVVAYYEALAQNLPGETEEIKEKPDNCVSPT
jgi:hypothetical protein